MAVEFKSSMSKNELLEIAAEHGIEADDSMKKNDILKLLEQARAAEGAQEPQDGAETPPEGNDQAEGDEATQEPQDGAETPRSGNDPAAGDEATQEPQDGEESTTGDSDTEPPAEDAQEAAPEGYGLFVYAGPSLPHGRLKEHAVFNGTFEDVKAYLCGRAGRLPAGGTSDRSRGAAFRVCRKGQDPRQYRTQVLQRHCFDNARKQGGINDGKLFSRRFDASERHVDFYPCNRRFWYCVRRRRGPPVIPWAAHRTTLSCVSLTRKPSPLWGYSDDWEKYTICEAIYSQFKLYGVAPVVFVNVLDPAKHKKSVAEQNYPVADGKVLLPLEALKNTVKVTSYTAGTDYELFYEGENLILEVLDGGSIPAETGELTITFDAVDPSKINENDIIGGFDTSTKKYSGLELIDKVFPKYGIVPDLIVAPGWSDKSNVAAVMTAKADAINTVFTGAKAMIDADTNTVRHYADVPAWKKAQNMNSKAEILCWPMFGLGDRAFHASVHAAGLMGKTDSDNGGCPAESPSNKSLQIDRAMLADGTTVLLDLAQANYLNSNGIVTALNFIGSYVLWGDETACFPADTDVKNYFISVSRMFGWVARSVILTYWSKIDKKNDAPPYRQHC